MKKFGFTLSEFLVAVGIVAVASALIAPTVIDLAPDKNKMKVISYYNKINEINQNLLSDDNLFFPQYAYDEVEDKKVLQFYGLANQLPPRNLINGWEESDQKNSFKYYNLFFYALTGIKYKTVNILEDGSEWKLTNLFNKNVTPHTVEFTFTIDIDGASKGKDCSYSSSCQQPDTFIFKVNEDGAVTPGDALTDAYLVNMGKSNSQKEDKALAKKFLSDTTKPYNG